MRKLTPRIVCEMAHALDGVTEKDHFGSDAFMANKRIFATVWHDKNGVNLRLSLKDQRNFMEQDGEGFVEIDNAWGREGWTKVQLEFVDSKLFEDALQAAWRHSAITLKKVNPRKSVPPTRRRKKNL